MDASAIELVKKAILSTCTGDSAWINEKESLRVTQDSSNQGLTAAGIRKLVQEWVRAGGELVCVKEERPVWRDKRQVRFETIVEGIDGFPKGLYVEMELVDDDPLDPIVALLNAHPPSFRKRK